MKATTLTLVMFACLLLAGCAVAEEPAAVAEELALETEDDKVFYMLGMAVSRNLVAFELDDSELAKVQAGLADGVLGRDSRVDVEVYAPKIDAALQARVAQIIERHKEAGAAFLASASQEAGAEVTTSGLVYQGLEAGDGPSPGPTDTVRIHYRGTLEDGEIFDSSLDEEGREPATFALNGVIPCFAEGLGKMNVGGKAKLTCPPDLAYGDQGAQVGIPPGATIQFEVQLLEIVAPPEPPAEPSVEPTPVETP